MRWSRWGLSGAGLVVLVVGLVALGVPASTVLIAAVALGCPLMMLFTMRGHGGHDGEDPALDRHTPSACAHDHEASPGGGRSVNINVRRAR